MSETPLCRLDELDDPGSLAATARINGKDRAVMVVRRGDGVHVYLNVCPHIGGPLDFTPGQFLNLDKSYIQCATHGALFQIDDGLCVKGPCATQSLTPVTSEVRDGRVFLSTPAAP